MNAMLRRSLAWLMSAALVLQPVAASASAPPIVVDPASAGARGSTTVEVTQSGIPQVNIATPNGARVSNNNFTKFNVPSVGAILNNAAGRGTTTTQLAGAIINNPNEAVGQTASTIINQVTGSSQSLLNGFLEVAGQQANVVIANPSGVSCAGCGFINTSRATITTGTPVFAADGSLQGFNVRQGNIDVSGNGLNASQVPVLDLLSRSITLEAAVNGQGTINAVTGQNHVDYNTGAVTPLASDGSAAPLFSIDSSALGGMFAGRIMIDATETGVGVNQEGTLAANAGQMTLSTNGMLTNTGTIAAQGALAVSAAAVSNAGTIGSAGGNTSVTSDGAVSNSGTISAPGTTQVQVASLSNTGSILGNSGNGIVVSGAVQNQGQIGSANGTASLSAGTLDNQSGGLIGSSAGTALTVAGDVNNTGNITSSDGLTVNAGTLENNAGASLGAAAGDVALTVSGVASNVGTIAASTGNLTVTAASLSNSGEVGADQALQLTLTDDASAPADGALSNSGAITAQNGALMLQAGSLENQSTGQIGAGAGLAATVTGDVTNAGTFVGNNGLTFSAATLENNAGASLGAVTGDVNLTVTGAASNDGLITAADGTLSLGAANLANSGTVFGDNAVALSISGQFDNAGTAIAQAGELTLQANALSNETNGQIGSGAGLMVAVAGDATNNGKIVGGAGLTLNSTTLVNNAGASLGATSGNVDLTQTGLFDNAGVVLAEADGVTLQAGSLTNESSGQIGASGVVQARVTGTASNAAKISGIGGVTLLLSGLDNTGGTIQSANGAIGIDGSNGAAMGAITNTGGTIQATAGGLTINAASLTGDGVLNAGGALTLTLASGLANTDSITAGSLALTLGGDLANSGQIAATNGNATITADVNPSLAVNGITNSGILAASDVLTLTGASLTDSETGLVFGSGGADITVSGNLQNNEGAILADTGTLTLNAASIDNVSGLIENTAGDVTINAGTVTNEVQGGVTLVSGMIYDVTFTPGFATDNLTGVTTAVSTQAAAPVPGSDQQFFDGPAIAVLFPLDSQDQFLDFNDDAPNSVTVTGDVSADEANGAAPLIKAGGNLTFNNAQVTNNAGDIVAGGNITFNGGSLNNIGYASTESFFVACPPGFGSGNHAGACRVDAPEDSSFAPPVALPGDIFDGSGVLTELWFTTSFAGGAASIVSAGGNITGNLTGDVDNSSVIAEASPGQLVQFSSNPVIVSSSGALNSNAQSLNGVSSTGGLGAVNGAVQPSSLTAANIINSLPGGNALFVADPSPGAHFLINSTFQDSTPGLLGSSFLLSALGINPNNEPPFLGDSYFDTNSISEQILQETGGAFLSGYSSQDDEMAALDNNAAADAASMGLTLGTALTADQIASLTNPTVWYVDETVDGETVLAPVLYLPPNEAQLTPSGAVIAANNISLTASTITNQAGTIQAADNLSLTAVNGSITNTASTSVLNVLGGTEQLDDGSGTISAGGDLALSASNAVTNLGSMLSAGGDLAVAASSIDLGVATVSTADVVTSGGISTYDSTTNVGSTVSAGGALSLAATNGDVTLTDTSVTANSATIVASGNVNIDAATNTVDSSYSAKNIALTSDTVTNEGTSINTTNGLSVAAIDNVNITASTLASGGATTVAAGQDLNVTAATNTDDSSFFFKKSGFLSSSINSGSSDVQTLAQSAITGSTVTLLAGNNATLTAADVAATGDVSITAANALTIGAGTETDTETSFVSHHGFGAAISGIGVDVGEFGSSTSGTSTSSMLVGSNIGSVSGDVTLQAGTAPLTVTASTLFAGNDLTLSGPSVALNAGQDTETQSETQKQNFAGVSVSVGGAAGAVANGIESGVQSGEQGDTTLGALQAAEAGLQGADGFLSDTSNAGNSGISNAQNLAQVDISLAASGSKSTQNGTATQAVGDTLTGNDITVAATSGDVTATAASLIASNDLTIAAAHDILLQSGQDTTTVTSSSHSSAGSIGVSVGLNGGLGVTASGSLAESKGNGTSTTQVSTVADAGNALLLSSGSNTTLSGAQGNAAEIVADVGGDLDISSFQNTQNSTFTSSSAAASVTVSFSGAVSGSLNLSQTNINDNGATVGAGQQSGLVASNSLNATVAGNTALDGGILSAPTGSLTTGSLTAENIANSFGSSGSTTGISLSSNGFMPGGASTSDSGSGTTQATVSSGITINAANGVPDGLNRSTADANDTAIDNFNFSSTENQLETQQIGAELFGQVANEAAGIIITQQHWSEDSPQALALHGLIGVAQGAIAGGGSTGSIIAGGAGAVAGTAIIPAMQSYLQSQGIAPTSTEGQQLLALASTIVGGAVGAATGSGNVTVNVTSGGMAAAFSEIFNAAEDDAADDGNDTGDSTGETQQQLDAQVVADHPVLGPIILGFEDIFDDITGSGNAGESTPFTGNLGLPDTNTGTVDTGQPATAPSGQSGSPMQIQPGTNAPATIGGINFSGHALDEMQADGITPSVVQNALDNVASVTGKVPGTTAYLDSTNNITVIQNSETGNIITVSRGLINQ
jgi:filamentous hemagglutinin